MDTMTVAAPAAPAAPETNNERRHRMRNEATARHAAMVLTTRATALTQRGERLATGFMGREGYVAWTQEQRDAIREDLDGTTVTLTLQRLAATKRGNRVTVTGVTDSAGHRVAIRGEATVIDIADASTLDGARVEVKLTAKRGERRNGSPFTGFSGESVGVASTGQRIGIRATLQASRHVRIVASAL